MSISILFEQVSRKRRKSRIIRRFRNVVGMYCCVVSYKEAELNDHTTSRLESGFGGKWQFWTLSPALRSGGHLLFGRIFLRSLYLILLAIVWSNTAIAIPIVGILDGSIGDVSITRGGATFFASAGETVLSGDVIATGENAKASIKAEDDTYRLALASTSTVVIRKREVDHRALLKLLKGQVRSKVKPLKPGDEFRVITRTCYGGVRGTDFIVSEETFGCALSTFEGSVLLDNVVLELLPDFLFADPASKTIDSLLDDIVIESSYDIGAGNSILVNEGFYSLVEENIPPISPLPGRYFGHVDEPPTWFLLAFMGLLFLIRRARQTFANGSCRGPSLGHPLSRHLRPAYSSEHIRFGTSCLRRTIKKKQNTKTPSALGQAGERLEVYGSRVRHCWTSRHRGNAGRVGSYVDSGEDTGHNTQCGWSAFAGGFCRGGGDG